MAMVLLSVKEMSFLRRVLMNQLVDLNLPICGICAALVFVYLQLKVPHGTFKEKILSLDWT